MKTDCRKERGKQKRVAEEEEEDQNYDGKTVSNEILKGQVRTAKSGRPSQKTEGDGRGKWKKLPSDVDPTPQGSKGKKKKISISPKCVANPSSFV